MTFPWGKRRNTNGQADTTDSLAGLTTDRGYTEHEHLDEMGLIHMNGRVYDPLVGRMMSADPFVQYIHSMSSFNRYSYVRNNPLKARDPSGFLELSGDPDTDASNALPGMGTPSRPQPIRPPPPPPLPPVTNQELVLVACNGVCQDHA